MNVRRWAVISSAGLVVAGAFMIWMLSPSDREKVSYRSSAIEAGVDIIRRRCQERWAAAGALNFPSDRIITEPADGPNRTLVAGIVEGHDLFGAELHSTWAVIVEYEPEQQCFRELKSYLAGVPFHP